jgi:hypothetical protein
LLSVVDAKKPLETTNAVTLNDWSIKLGVLDGFKGYFCVF